MFLSSGIQACALFKNFQVITQAIVGQLPFLSACEESDGLAIYRIPPVALNRYIEQIKRSSHFIVL